MECLHWTFGGVIRQAWSLKKGGGSMDQPENTGVFLFFYSNGEHWRLPEIWNSQNDTFLVIIIFEWMNWIKFRIRNLKAHHYWGTQSPNRNMWAQCSPSFSNEIIFSPLRVRIKTAFGVDALWRHPTLYFSIFYFIFIFPLNFAFVFFLCQLGVVSVFHTLTEEASRDKGLHLCQILPIWGTPLWNDVRIIIFSDRPCLLTHFEKWHSSIFSQICLK